MKLNPIDWSSPIVVLQFRVRNHGETQWHATLWRAVSHQVEGEDVLITFENGPDYQMEIPLKDIKKELPNSNIGYIELDGWM